MADEYDDVVDIINIYNFYYNKKSKKVNENMFTGTNPFDKHSVNNKMIEFMKDLNTYKLLQDSDIIIYTTEPTNKHIYKCLTVDNKIYYCKSIIPLLIHMLDLKWNEVEWDII